jgi:hypothetical protein
MEDGHKYITNKNLTTQDLAYYADNNDETWVIDINILIDAAKLANSEIKKEVNFNKDRPISLLANIPKKNLSGAVGECLGRSYSLLLNGRLGKNPHESGSPDFIPIVEESSSWFSEPTKDIFRGGFDTKACLTEKGEFTKVKPSSHHDQTTTILTVQWRHDDGIPEIIGAFFTNSLNSSDWNVSKKPVKEGSKITNSATLKASGVHKIRSGWLFMRGDIKIPSKEIVNLYNLHELCDYQKNGKIN